MRLPALSVPAQERNRALSLSANRVGAALWKSKRCSTGFDVQLPWASRFPAVAPLAARHLVTPAELHERSESRFMFAQRN
jgi:hypothetical protein